MSTAVQDAGGAVVILPPMGDLSEDAIVKASKTRWAWNPYREINNMGPLGLKRPMGFGTARWTELKRCNVYPLGNISWTIEDIDAIIEQASTGISITSTRPLPRKIFTKYAYDQVQELIEIYGETYGVRILDPFFLGEDDPQVINRVFTVVQPQVFKLHEMELEFGAKARRRIEDSQLKPAEREKAYLLADSFLTGGRVAMKEAKREYQDLISSMGKASVGQPGIATPNDFHEWLCDQMGVACPSPVDKSPRQNAKLEEAITVLANRAVREESAAESLLEELRTEREARQSLEARIEAMEEAKTTPTKGK